MSIAAIIGLKNEKLALCACDLCCAEVKIPARHGNGKGFGRGGTLRPTLFSENAVIEALRKRGWAYFNGKLRCPKCTAARNPKNQGVTLSQSQTSKPEAKAPGIRPVGKTAADFEIDIIVALSSVYDRKAMRYSGAETDTTVAEVLGEGCMPGWVSEIRQAKFGPAGNEEVETIRAEIVGLRAATDKALNALSARLDACVAAHDKRVRS